MIERRIKRIQLRALMVDDELPTPTAEGHAARTLVQELQGRAIDVVEAPSAEDGMSVVVSDSAIHALLLDWALGSNGARDHAKARALLQFVRSRNDKVPIFLMAERGEAASIPIDVMEMVDEYIWTLEDTAAFVGGRVVAAMRRYLEGMMPPLAAATMKFSQDYEYSWHTPGHTGGTAFLKSPVGRMFFDYFGENLLRSDLSISVGALGSLLDQARQGPTVDGELLAEVFSDIHPRPSRALAAPVSGDEGGERERRRDQRVVLLHQDGGVPERPVGGLLRRDRRAQVGAPVAPDGRLAHAEDRDRCTSRDRRGHRRDVGEHILELTQARRSQQNRQPLDHLPALRWKRTQAGEHGVGRMRAGVLERFYGSDVMTLFRAMMNGDKDCAVTLHEMDEHWDAGPVLARLPAELRHDLSFLENMMLLGVQSGTFLARQLMRAERSEAIAAEKQGDSRYWGFPDAQTLAQAEQAGIELVDHDAVREQYLGLFVGDRFHPLAGQFCAGFDDFVRAHGHD